MIFMAGIVAARPLGWLAAMLASARIGSGSIRPGTFPMLHGIKTSMKVHICTVMSLVMENTSRHMQ
jgi:hypothetical protein